MSELEAAFPKRQGSAKISMPPMAHQAGRTDWSYGQPVTGSARSCSHPASAWRFHLRSPPSRIALPVNNRRPCPRPSGSAHQPLIHFQSWSMSLVPAFCALARSLFAFVAQHSLRAPVEYAVLYPGIAPARTLPTNRGRKRPSNAVARFIWSSIFCPCSWRAFGYLR